jgi:hypothetical protein
MPNTCFGGCYVLLKKVSDLSFAILVIQPFLALSYVQINELDCQRLAHCLGLYK